MSETDPSKGKANKHNEQHTDDDEDGQYEYGPAFFAHHGHDHENVITRWMQASAAMAAAPTPASVRCVLRHDQHRALSTGM